MPAMADTFRCAAVLLDMPARVPDGSAGITGHSLRATGAQGLARLGLGYGRSSSSAAGGSEAVKASGSGGRAPAVALRSPELTPPPDPCPEWIITRRRKGGQWLLHLAAYPLVDPPEDAKLTHCCWRFGGLSGIVLTP